MTVYTPAQVAAIAASAGFKGQALTKAVAVALAESGGNPQAVNVNSDSTRSRDRGLWQINSRWHPEVSDAQAFNPVECARAAYRISSGGRNWQPWATWPVAAGAQMGRARFGVAQLRRGKGGIRNVGDDFPGIPDPLLPLVPDPFGLLPGEGPLDDMAPDGMLSGLASVVDVLKQWTVLQLKAGAWMADSHNWLRVAWMAGGTVGVLIALGMIGKSGAAGEMGRKAAAAAGTAGDAAKILALKKVG